jgi:hypothetical protein
MSRCSDVYDSDAVTSQNHAREKTPKSERFEMLIKVTNVFAIFCHLKTMLKVNKRYIPHFETLRNAATTKSQPL